MKQAGHFALAYGWSEGQVAEEAKDGGVVEEGDPKTVSIAECGCGCDIVMGG